MWKGSWVSEARGLTVPPLSIGLPSGFRIIAGRDCLHRFAPGYAPRIAQPIELAENYFPDDVTPSRHPVAIRVSASLSRSYGGVTVTLATSYGDTCNNPLIPSCNERNL